MLCLQHIGTLLSSPSFLLASFGAHTKGGDNDTVRAVFSQHLGILWPPTTAKQGNTENDKSTLFYPPALPPKAELKVTHLRWRSPISGFLRFPAKIFGFLRKICGFLPFPAPSKCWNFQEKGWICENLRFSAKICVLASLCHLSSVPLRAPRLGVYLVKILGVVNFESVLGRFWPFPIEIDQKQTKNRPKVDLLQGVQWGFWKVESHS